MVFSSIIFLFFFLPLSLFFYFSFGPRFRNTILLGASVVFYAWGEGLFVLILFLSIGINWAAGLIIHRFRQTPWAGVALYLGLSINVLLLVIFKYSEFIVGTINSVTAGFLLEPITMDPVHLPIGISFFTFQAITYIVDIFRGQAPVQHSPLNVGLYISLFPQLIAGPIVRYNSFAAYIKTRVVSLENFAEGIERFIVGLGKKVLIANNLAVVSDRVFGLDFTVMPPSVAWTGILCYTLQIYFDFSGYSDMAIGLGKMFGFSFPENFNYPYMARSVRQFWRRWHMTLSSWFRDYLYIPLGGSRKGAVRTCFNLYLVFFLCGLWHGASWSFVVWGLWHGLFISLERFSVFNRLEKLGKPFGHCYLLLVVMTGWVFFRCETLKGALLYLKAMMGFYMDAGIPGLYFYHDYLFIASLAAAVMFSIPLGSPWPKAENRTVFLATTRRVFVSAVLLLSVSCLAAGSYNPFIYFRF